MISMIALRYEIKLFLRQKSIMKEKIFTSVAGSGTVDDFSKKTKNILT